MLTMTSSRARCLLVACLASASVCTSAFAPSPSALRARPGALAASRSVHVAHHAWRVVPRKGPGLMMSLKPPQLKGEVYGKERVEAEEKVSSNNHSFL